MYIIYVYIIYTAPPRHGRSSSAGQARSTDWNCRVLYCRVLASSLGELIHGDDFMYMCMYYYMCMYPYFPSPTMNYDTI